MKKFPPLYIGLLLLAAAGLLLWLNTSSRSVVTCGQVKEEEVRGSSLEGLIENGSMVRIRYGFQLCESINRGDVVAFRSVMNNDPLLKVVKGVPGDRLQVALAQGGVKVFINDQALENSLGHVYRLHASAYDLLSLYVQDYGGVIPEGAYLLLGNRIGGTLDSSRFGLADGASIIGKMIE